MVDPESYPYYIMTPDYKTSSLGIQVMHYLCHLLNEKGHQAWIINAKTNPEWNTPVLPAHLFQQHKKQQIPFIAVYPDIISGNPLDAKVIARYMLNHEGKMNGNEIGESENDLFYWYRTEFADKTINPTLLKLECFDLDLFCDDGQQRNLNLLYLNRVPESIIDFSCLPKDIEIISMRNPLSLEKLAEKFKRAKALYSFESSGTNTLASLCGCPVVALKAKGYEQYAVTESTLKDDGLTTYCWDDEPETLEQARNNGRGLHQQLLAGREESRAQLDFFIEETQASAIKISDEVKNSLLDCWVTNRNLPVNYPLLNARDRSPRLLIIVHASFWDEIKVNETVNSILSQSCDVEINLVSNDKIGESFLGSKVIAASHFPHHLKFAIECQQYDWVMNIPAGVTLARESLPVVYHFLKSNDYSAVGCHELWLKEDRKSWLMERDVIQEETLFSAPHIYMKRWIFSCAAIRSLNGQVIRYNHAYESDLLVRLRTTLGPQSIGYHTDILCIVNNYEIDLQELQESALVIKDNLLARGYQDVRVSVAPEEPVRIEYISQSLPLISAILIAGSDVVVLENALMSFLENTRWDNHEIIIVNPDNNTDIVNEWLDAVATINPDKIRVVEEKNRSSHRQLLELGARYARGDYFLFIDSSVKFLIDNWLSLLINPMNSEKVGCTGPKLIARNKKIISCGLSFNHLGGLESVNSGLPWNTRAVNYMLSTATAVTAVDRRCWLVSRSCWQVVGGFESVPENMSAVEIGFMIRAYAMGYKTLVVPDSVVIGDEDETEYSVADHEVISDMMSSLPFSFRASNKFLGLISGYKQQTITQSYMHKSWIARRQNGIPLFAIVGNSQGDRHLTRFFQMLNGLENNEKIDVIYLDGINDSHILMQHDFNVIVICSGVVMPLKSTINYIKNNATAKLYLLLDECMLGGNISSWLESDLLSGCLAYSHEQKIWLKKRNKKCIPIPEFYLEKNSRAMDEEKSRTKRIFCDTRFLNQDEINFLTPVIKKTSSIVNWIIHGKYPREWIQHVHESRRARRDDRSIISFHDLSIDIAVLPVSSGKYLRYRDDYELKEYLSYGLEVITSLDTSAINVPKVKSVRNKSHEWVKVLRSMLGDGEKVVCCKESSMGIDEIQRKYVNFLAILSGKEINNSKLNNEINNVTAEHVGRV